MPKRRKNRASRSSFVDKVAEASSDDSLGSITNTEDYSDDSCEFHDNADQKPATKKASNTRCTQTNALPSTPTLSNLSTASAKREDSLFIQTSLKQTLFVFTVFLLGINTGISYVGFVHGKYGYGRDPALEATFLPYGPTTHRQTSELLASQSAVLSNQADSNAKTKKQIRLNRDSDTLPKPAFSTLYGLEYDSIIGPPPSDNTKQVEVPSAVSVSATWYHLASSKQVSPTSSQVEMIRSVAQKAHENIPELKQRAGLVPWGGPHNAVPETSWWPEKRSSDTTALEGLDGGKLLNAYLFIMKWNPRPRFPFRLCGENGCPPERAISHSLEWREKYKPWLAPPSLLEENVNGISYHRGFSPSETANGKHGTVWLRLRHTVKDDLAYFRSILHASDRAVAESLVESKGETGRINVIIDCAGFSLRNAPTLNALKQGVTMFQDHYPNRLGMIFLANVPRTGEMFLNVVLRLITKEVRDKVKVLPSFDKTKALAILRKVVEEEYIPDWLGGTDTYRFDVEKYYPAHLRCTEEEGREFLTSMPYHAK